MKKCLCFIMAFLCLVMAMPSQVAAATSQDNTLYAESQSCTAGLSFTLSVKMANTVSICGFQFDLVLPPGLSVATDNKGDAPVALSLDRTTAKKTNYFDYVKQQDGSYRVMAGSTKLYAFTGNDGEVVTVVIDVAKTMTQGNYTIMLKNIILSDTQSKTYKTEQTTIPFSVVSDNPYWTILYTSSDGKVITPKGEFGANIISNTYANGKGKIQLDGKATCIGIGAFYECDRLTAITIPESVKSIDSFAFGECLSLTSISIPNSVTAIGNMAFLGCASLTSVVVNWDEPLPISSYAFYDGVNLSACTLYVPKGTKSLYASAEVWKDFGDIVEFEAMDDGVEGIAASSDVNIHTSGNIIAICGAKENDVVKVYSLGGALKKAGRGNARIVLDTGGVYIVKVGQDSFMIRL